MNVLGGGSSNYIVQQNSCNAFPKGTLDADPKLKAVRAFGIIVLIVGGMLTWFLWLAPCLYFARESTWKAVAIIFSVILTVFQGLTFLVFHSSFCTDNSILSSYKLSNSYSTDCAWDQGSTSNAISVVLWFLTGVAMLLVGAPKRPVRPPPETQTVTYHRTENPDGGTTVAEVGVVKGTYVPTEKAYDEEKN
jgi:hypothetical protein